MHCWGLNSGLRFSTLGRRKRQAKLNPTPVKLAEPGDGEIRDREPEKKWSLSSYLTLSGVLLINFAGLDL
jgi:hypothetical protein